MTAFVIITMVATVLLVGGLLAVTPRLMPPTECFAVTVPPSAQDDPRIRTLKRRYTTGIIATTIACEAALVAFCALTSLDTHEGAERFSLAVLAATMVLLAAGYILMLRSRAQVQKLKRAEGWTATGSQAAAVVGAERGRGAISLLWNLLYLPVIGMLLATGALFYDRFPAQIPLEIELDGTVSRMVPKSPAAVFFPVAVVLFIALVMIFSHWSILHAKRPLDPAAPATSALAYDIFARKQSIVLVASGLFLSTVIGVTFYLSILGTISLGMSAVLVTVAALVFVGAEIWVSIALGQSGSRLAARLRTSDEVARDDDAHWLLGMIYCNAADPSIMVPKRFGVGWTMNVARPASWALIGLLVVLCVAFVWATSALIG